ncbi:unnamed protein product, partial [Adineta steineri]
RVRIENAFHSYQMNRFDIEKEMLSSLKDIRGLPIQDQKQNFIQSNVRQTVRFYDAIQAIIKDEVANVFLEISPHPVLEDEQITLLTSLEQLTTLSHVWQQYFHTRQILPLKNHEEYFDNFPLYKFHLSPYWYESKDSAIQRLANRIPTHPSLGIRQLNEQTSATWKSLININLPEHSFLKDHKIHNVIFFSVVAYLELATAACHQLLSSKEDDQQQLTLIFKDINFIKALILNEHELMEVFIQIIMPMREWYIIFCNQDNLNKYSLNQFTLHAQGKIEIDSKQQKSLTIPDRWTIQDIRILKKIKTLRDTSTTIISQLSNDNNNSSSYYLLHPYLVLLPGVETIFLPVRILKFIYSSKTKAKMNQSTNIEVCGNYYDNICGIGREEIYSLDLWTFPMDNKIEEPIFTFESIVIQQIQGVQSGRCNQDLTESIEPFNELATYYAQMAIKDLDLNQQHHPLLNACRSLASTLHLEQVVTWHSTRLRLIQLIEHFPRLKPFLIIVNKYGSHLKDILSGEKTGLDIFLDDDETGETFQQVKTLISATKTQHIFHSICQYLQLQYEQQIKDNSFENYRLRIFWLSDSHCSDVLPILDLFLNLSQQTDETIDLYDSKTLEQIPLESSDIIFSANQLLGNQDLINCLISLRRLLVPNGFDIIESTLNQNESTFIICQKTISNEILQRLDERINQIWLIFIKDDNNSFGHILSSLLPCSNIRIFDIRHSTLDTICFGISVLLTTYKQVSIIFAWQLDQVALNENNDDLAFN